MINTPVPVKPPATPDLPSELTPLEGEPAALAGLELSEQLVATRDWSGRDAAGIQLAECHLEGVSLDEAKLQCAGIRDVVVDGGSWANVDATGAVVKRVELRNTRLTGAAFANAKIEDVVFVECRLDLASFRFAKLAYVRFEDCLMTESDFYEAAIKSSIFSSCSLAGASLAAVTFADTELRGCDLTAIGNAERLRGARMTLGDLIQSADTLAAGLGIEIVE
jgi:fluoroquinolone resistance protein